MFRLYIGWWPYLSRCPIYYHLIQSQSLPIYSPLQLQESYQSIPSYLPKIKTEHQKSIYTQIKNAKKDVSLEKALWWRSVFYCRIGSFEGEIRSVRSDGDSLDPLGGRFAPMAWAGGLKMAYFFRSRVEHSSFGTTGHTVGIEPTAQHLPSCPAVLLW